MMFSLNQIKQCIENCKIRVRKGSPWIDGFIPLRTWLVDIPVNYFRTNEEWKKMDKQEKLDHLDALMKQQVKKAAKKGTELIVGKLDDLPEEFKTIPASIANKTIFFIIPIKV